MTPEEVTYQEWKEAVLESWIDDDLGQDLAKAVITAAVVLCILGVLASLIYGA